MTKSELVRRQGELPAITERLEFIREERSRLYAEEQELMKLEYTLGEVDEIFEGVPIKVWGSTNFGCEELGDDGEIRQAFVNPYYLDEEEEKLAGYLLKLSGVANRYTGREWKKYTSKDAAILAAKRHVAHGLVPLPDNVQID